MTHADIAREIAGGLDVSSDGSGPMHLRMTINTGKLRDAIVDALDHAWEAGRADGRPTDPVAWRWRSEGMDHWAFTDSSQIAADLDALEAFTVVPLYARP